MWMKIYETLLVAGGLAISGAAFAPEYIAPLPEPDPIVEIVEEIVLDQKELQCLQKNIYFEARDQGRAGMRAVAAVTINRTNDPRWPDTICKVVYQRKQFSWANRGDRNPRLHNAEEMKAWRIAGEIAEKAMLRTMINEVGGAQYFHNDRVNPRWGFQHVKTIGNHTFYYQPL